MRKLLTGIALMACVQAAAAAAPTSPDPAHDAAGEVIAAGLGAVYFKGRPLVAEDGLMVAQQPPAGTIGTTPMEPQTTTTTTSQTTTETPPPPARRDSFWGRKTVVAALGVLAVAILVFVVTDDDDDPAPAPDGTGAN